MTLRSIDTRFWSDGWIRKLNALDRYLLIYLLTNDHTTWCGIYELDIAMMAFESGIDKDDLEKSMLPRLNPKVIYADGWVYVHNWLKYHMSDSGTLSPQQKEGYKKALQKVPERVMKKLSEAGILIPYAYPMGWVSPSSSSSSSSSSLSSTYSSITAQSAENNNEDEISVEPDEDTVLNRGFKRKPIDNNARVIMDSVSVRFPNPKKQMAHIRQMLDSGYTREKILETWDELINDEFWGSKGVDFGTVLANIARVKNVEKKPDVLVYKPKK